MLIELAEAHALCVEAAPQQVIGQGAKQVLGADAEIVSGVARVLDPLHMSSVKLRTAGAFPFVVFARRFALFFFGGEASLFRPADAAMRVEPLENKFGSRDTQSIRLARAQSQSAHFFRQPLDGA